MPDEAKREARFVASAHLWTLAMRPYVHMLEAVELPPRGRAGSRANTRRMRITQAAIHQVYIASLSPAAQRCHDRRACWACRVRVPLRRA